MWRLNSFPSKDRFERIFKELEWLYWAEFSYLLVALGKVFKPWDLVALPVKWGILIRLL